MMCKEQKDLQTEVDREKRLRHKAEQSLKEMRQFLFDYFYLLGPDPKKNMSIVVKTLGKVIGSDVALYNRLESNTLKTWCIDNEPEGYKREDAPEGHICYDMTIRKRTVSSLKPVIFNNLEGTEWEKLDSNVSQYGIKAYLGYPIPLNGKVVGSLCVVDTKPRVYTDVESYIIGAFASAIRLEEERLLTQERLASAVLDLQKKNKEVEELALTDSLTGLPNRRAMIAHFDDELATLYRNLASAENTGEFSIVVCDIDHFKSINDTYGHSCGDIVLQTIAKILSSGLRGWDKVARWGGEEFLLLFPKTNISIASTIAERLRKTIEETKFSHEGEAFQVTMTFGISSCNSADSDGDTCMKEADIALYTGKENGRNQVVIYGLKNMSVAGKRK